jgi:periplasmic protein TonB
VTEATGLTQQPLGARRCRKESQILTSQAMSPDPTPSAAVDPAPRFEMRVRESIVVLSNDASLAAAVRTVSAAEHELFVVQAEADLATHLMSNAAGVVVLDTAAVVSAIAQLTQRLRAQFPDVVLIVAGGAYEQAALTAQVTSGAVYRFLHKPASEQRIRLFIDAAWRRRSAEHTGNTTTGTLRKLSEPIAPRRLALPLGIAAVVVAAVAGIGGWLMGQRGSVAPPPPRHAAASVAAPVAPTDVLLNQLLARAAEASARGDLITPVGSSASDLYRQALEHHHGDSQAQAGLAKVVDQVLSAAEQDLLAQRLDEAEHMTLAARALQPDSVRVSFLTTQIARERERATRAQAQAQARLQLQQQQADELERQQKLIAAARTALTAGNLDEAAHLIASAAAAGVARDAIDTLTRDLQGARLVAKMNETPAHAAPVPAIETPPAAAVQTAPAAAAAAHVDDVVSASTLERVTYVEPEYPLLAREQGTSGWVDLAFNVQLDGSVNDVAVLASEPKNMFEHDAIAAVRKWRYRPAQRDGSPVVQRARLRIRFTVK